MKRLKRSFSNQKSPQSKELPSKFPSIPAKPTNSSKTHQKTISISYEELKAAIEDSFKQIHESNLEINLNQIQPLEKLVLRQQDTIEQLISRIDRLESKLSSLNSRKNNPEQKPRESKNKSASAQKISKNLARNASPTGPSPTNLKSYLDAAISKQPATSVKSIHIDLQTPLNNLAFDDACEWICKNSKLPKKCYIHKIIEISQNKSSKFFKLTIKVPLNYKLVDFIGEHSKTYYPPKTSAKKFRFNNNDNTTMLIDI